MMKHSTKVAVCSRSFSKNPVLRAELLERYQQVTFNDEGLQLNGDSLVAFLSGHQKAIIALEEINEEVLSQLPELKVISKYGVGMDKIDFDAMSEYGKRFGWTGGVNRRSVSELVIAFAISLLRLVPQSHKEVVDGVWRQQVGKLLTGRSIGIVGCGFVGKDLVELLKPFACTIYVNDIKDYAEFYSEHELRPVSLDELLKKSDIVTLHVPLDDSTRGLLSKEKLALMQPDSILINTARGGLVDEGALRNMLETGALAAAGFDVFQIEPPEDSQLLELPNFLVTQHIGGSASEAILAMGRAAIDGLEHHSRCLAGSSLG
jgi:phosphoglycerate dehydrogenase-like enzyme